MKLLLCYSMLVFLTIYQMMFPANANAVADANSLYDLEHSHFSVIFHKDELERKLNELNINHKALDAEIEVFRIKSRKHDVKCDGTFQDISSLEVCNSEADELDKNISELNEKVNAFNEKREVLVQEVNKL